MKIDVLTIGELLADVISEQCVASLKEAKTFRLFQGGSPANVCANLKWLGDDAVMVSCVGNDSVGDMVLDSIRRIGLTDQYISRSKTYPTTIVLVGRSQGTPDFVAYRMADTQIAPIEKALIKQTSILHSCAFALSRDPAQQNILLAFDQAITMGKKVSIDWNFAPGIWPTDGTLVFKRICEMRPLLKMSMDDVSRYWGKTMSIEEAKNLLTTLTTTITCLTCGKDGVWFKADHADEWSFLPAVFVEAVKDTTGAGDAFWSGFLHAYLKNQHMTACVQEGLNIAAKKIQKVGPLYLD
jgi:fructokinase